MGNKTGGLGTGARGILGAVLLVMVSVIVQAQARGEAQNRCERVDQLLRELKDLYLRDLITKDLYKRKVNELLERGEIRCAPAVAVPEDSGPDLSGVWRLSVEDLDIWAPRYTLVKATGRIRWKLSADDGDLSLFEYDPGAESPGARPADGPPGGELFEEVEIREVIVHDDLVAFKVEGVSGAYEAYWLEHFSENEIAGTYTVYDRYGGGPGSGPEYRARLILERVE